MYIIRLFNLLTVMFETKCLNAVVTPYSGIITKNCSDPRMYFLVQERDCEQSRGVVSENYHIHSTDGYCVVKEEDFQQISNILDFHPSFDVEVVHYLDANTIVDYMLRFVIFLLTMTMILMCLGNTLRTIRVSSHVREIPQSMETLPVTISRSDYIQIEGIPEQECSICMEPLDEQVVQLSCEHSFHQKCITEWFKNSPRCPLCNNQG